MGFELKGHALEGRDNIFLRMSPIFPFICSVQSAREAEGIQFSVSGVVNNNIRGRELVGAQETLMIAKHEKCIDFYGASERWS